MQRGSTVFGLDADEAEEEELKASAKLACSSESDLSCGSPVLRIGEAWGQDVEQLAKAEALPIQISRVAQLGGNVCGVVTSAVWQHTRAYLLQREECGSLELQIHQTRDPHPTQLDLAQSTTRPAC